MKHSKSSISDIAKALNISAMSVSRALSGKPGISDSLRAKVHETAEAMGYLKHKLDVVKRVLVLHQKPFTPDSSNYSAMLQGMEKALQAKGIDYHLEYFDKSRQEQLALPSPLTKGLTFDGVIFIGNFNDAFVAELAKKIPNQVFYAGYNPSCEGDSVWTNFNNNGFQQCEYLIRQGHKTIGFISSIEAFRNKERLLGIMTALEKHQLPVRQDLFINFDGEFGEDMLDLLKSDDAPTAFICQWDFLAITFIKFLNKHGYAVPKDLSIIGSGNTDMSTLCHPSLTTLELHIDYSCEAAVSLLIRRIESPSKPYENIGINSSLVERDSVRTLAPASQPLDDALHESR